METEWIPINEKQPKVTFDFKTLLEYQEISKPLLIKLDEGEIDNSTGWKD